MSGETQLSPKPNLGLEDRKFFERGGGGAYQGYDLPFAGRSVANVLYRRANPRIEEIQAEAKQALTAVWESVDDSGKEILRRLAAHPSVDARALGNPYPREWATAVAEDVAKTDEVDPGIRDVGDWLVFMGYDQDNDPSYIVHYIYQEPLREVVQAGTGAVGAQ